jgi:hypothetical protein
MVGEAISGGSIFRVNILRRLMHALLVQVIIIVR